LLSYKKPVRRKINGYILLFTRSDHDGRHIYVYKDNHEIGVYDRVLGPIRGLEDALSRELQEALEEFKTKISERGL
jgi:hypothetical protein